MILIFQDFCRASRAGAIALNPDVLDFLRFFVFSSSVWTEEFQDLFKSSNLSIVEKYLCLLAKNEKWRRFSMRKVFKTRQKISSIWCTNTFGAIEKTRKLSNKVNQELIRIKRIWNSMIPVHRQISSTSNKFMAKWPIKSSTFVQSRKEHPHFEIATTQIGLESIAIKNILLCACCFISTNEKTAGLSNSIYC